MDLDSSEDQWQRPSWALAYQNSGGRFKSILAKTRLLNDISARDLIQQDETIVF